MHEVAERAPFQHDAGRLLDPVALSHSTPSDNCTFSNGGNPDRTTIPAGARSTAALLPRLSNRSGSNRCTKPLLHAQSLTSRVGFRSPSLRLRGARPSDDPIPDRGCQQVPIRDQIPEYLVLPTHLLRVRCCQVITASWAIG
jgi:hypothetical protein